MTTTSAGSAKSLLASLAGASPSKGKKKAEKPVLVDATLEQSVSEFIRQKAARDSAEALMKAAEDQLLKAGHDFLLDTCQSRGESMSSIAIGVETAEGPVPKLTMTQQNRYSAIPQERAAAVREAFGKEFEVYFAETFAISLKDESANDEAVLRHTIEALGAEFIARHFDIRRDLAVRPTFHPAYLTRPEISAAAKPFLDDQTIKPYKASLKVT
jgi:hypothetical protein